MESVFGAKAEQRGLASKKHDGKLCIGVFQGEVNVPGWSGTEVGDFALNPDVGILPLDQFAGVADKLPHGPDAADRLRLFKAEVELRRG